VKLRCAGDKLLQGLAHKRKLEWLPPSGLVQLLGSSSPAYAAIELAHPPYTAETSVAGVC